MTDPESVERAVARAAHNLEAHSRTLASRMVDPALTTEQRTDARHEMQEIQRSRARRKK